MKTKSLAWIRLGFGALVLVAIASQLRIHIREGFDVVNFFSYFTNLSNIFAALVFLYGGSLLLAGKGESAVFASVRGAAALAMVIVGVVFSILLRDVDLGTLQPWVNTLLHYVFPVVVLADWLLAPPVKALTKRYLLWWLVYPLVYVTYSLIRGAQTGWYAYPFLNPAHVGSRDGVVAYCVGITVLFLVVGWGLLAYAKRRHPVSKRRKA